jgi:hypothetical protein
VDDIIQEAIENVEAEHRHNKLKLIQELIKEGEKITDRIDELIDNINTLNEDIDVVADDSFKVTVENIHKLKSHSFTKDMRCNISMANRVFGMPY